MQLVEEAKRLASGAGGGWLPPDAVKRLTAAAQLSLEQLMLELIPLARADAQPSISSFAVGAIGLGASGALYFGANLEFSACSLNQTIHAEQAVVVNAALHGETGLRRLAVSAPPCGFCRQFLYELATADQLVIVLAGAASRKLVEYLPDAFGPANLGVSGRLLASQRHRLAWVDPPACVTAAAEQTLRAAQSSYAPYSRAPAALGLTTLEGQTLTGPYLENAAFNPSVSPIQSAAVALRLAGRSLEDVGTAVVVQTENSVIDHTTAAEAVLKQVAPHVTVDRLLVRYESLAKDGCRS